MAGGHGVTVVRKSKQCMMGVAGEKKRLWEGKAIICFDRKIAAKSGKGNSHWGQGNKGLRTIKGPHQGNGTQ